MNEESAPRPIPREPPCPRCDCSWHLLPCDCGGCMTSAWHGWPDPETYPLTAY